MADKSTAAMFAERLRESGIPDKAAKRANLSPLEPDATARLWKGAPKQSAMLIPYSDPLGQATGFYRIRFLGKVNGFAQQLEKQPRYLQPPKTGINIYFPNVAGTNWLSILSDPAASLIITEGEFKALAATLNGFPTIGLGGVESWHSKAANEPFARDLESVRWGGRVVYICYDSDAATKPQVAEASRKLAEELGARGAIVYDATLPSVGSKKVGLDDFLLARGAEGLRSHLESVSEFANVRALHDFNQRFVFVRNLVKVYEESTGQFHGAYNFIKYTEADKTYVVTTTTQKGPRSEVRSIAADWIQWPNRREVEAITYRPNTTERIIEDNGKRLLNFWRGWGVEEKRGNVGPWRELFEYLTRSETVETRRWLLQWFAYPIQHPGTKLFSAVAIWGSAQGTGKTLLGETIIKLYGENGQRVGAEQLTSPYNGWAVSKQFILGDEITGNDSRGHADKLKGLITGEFVRVNEKYQPEFDIPNCINFYFTSNHPDAFYIDSQDRRHLIVEAPPAPLPDEFYKEYERWLRAEGPAALMYELRRVDLSGFNPTARPPRTVAHEIMSDVAQSEVGRFIHAVMTDPERAQRLYRVPADVELFTAHELLQYYDPRQEKKVSEKAISVELQKQGAAKVLAGAQVMCGPLGRLRLYAVRNTTAWGKASAGVVREVVAKRHLPSAKF